MQNFEGYLACCFGSELYMKLGKRLVENIRNFDKNRPICILTDNVELMTSLTKSSDLNLVIKSFDSASYVHDSIDMNNTWNKFGLIPKLYQCVCTPFEKTMFIDVDMLFKKDFMFLWDSFDKCSHSILMPGKCDSNNRSPPDWHWGRINNIIEKIGHNIPQVWSTLFIYDSSYKKIFMEDIDFVLRGLSTWSALSWYRSGYPDEIVYSIILGRHNIPTDQFIHDWFLDENNCMSFDKDL